jgi:hypothetical protein
VGFLGTNRVVKGGIKNTPGGDQTPTTGFLRVESKFKKNNFDALKFYWKL